MKCRYMNCKLGGEVDKDIAVKDGSSYYHEDCYKKKTFKKSTEEKLIRFPIKDLRMALKKAIDDNNYPIDFVDFIINRFNDKLTTPYTILYFAKNHEAIKFYTEMISKKAISEMSKNIKLIEVEKEVEFTFVKKTKPKWMKVYED